MQVRHIDLTLPSWVRRLFLNNFSVAVVLHILTLYFTSHNYVFYERLACITLLVHFKRSSTMSTPCCCCTRHHIARYVLLFVTVLPLCHRTATAEALPSPRAELSLAEIKRLVNDCIHANLALIDSLEATVHRKSFAVKAMDARRIPSSVRPEDQETIRWHSSFTYNVWHAQNKSRTSARWTDRPGDNAPVYRNHFESYFDGNVTRIYWPSERTAIIAEGMRDCPITKDLTYGYQYFSGQIWETLEHATSMSLANENNGGSTEIAVEWVTHEGTLRLVLNPSHGCLVEQAVAHDPQGRLVGMRDNVSLHQASNGAWFITSVVDTTYSFDLEGKRHLLKQNHVDIDIHTVNAAVDASVLDLAFPPGTAVNDQMSGRLYQIPSQRTHSESYTRSVAVEVAAASMATLVLVAITIAIVRRATREKEANAPSVAR